MFYIFQELALIMAAFYTGLALYINLVEQPARLSVSSDSELLTIWKTAYARGHIMGASTTVTTGLLGLIAFLTTHHWIWLLGAVVILANWPYTYLFIMPTNRKLVATENSQANQETRYLIKKWANLHAMRTVFGLSSTIIFLLALNYYR